MSDSFIKRHVNGRLATAKSNLASLLRDLETEASRARDALEKGDHMDTRLMANRVQIDVLSAEVNTLQALSGMMEDSPIPGEPEAEGQPKSACVSSDRVTVTIGGGRRR